jgi:hypothetical protein
LKHMTALFPPIFILLPALAALAAILAWWLRRAGLPAGHSVLGGILAGMLLGPTIFGRAVPDQFERWFLGGAAQRETLDSLISRQGADLTVARHKGFSPADVPLAERHARERALIVLQIEEARWTHQTAMRTLTLTLAGVVLFGGGLFAVHAHRQAHNAMAIVSIGLWSAALPGALAFICANRWWDLELGPSLMLVSALAIGPWALLAGDRHAANAAEVGGARMIQSAGRVASALAIGCAGAAIWLHLGSREILLAVPLLAIPLGWAVPILNVPLRRLASIFEFIIIPTLVAIAAFHLDWATQLAFWPIVIVSILCGDGRWFGALIGALLPGGRRGLRTMRLVLGAMAAGPTQLAVTALGLCTRALPESMAVALLIGVVVIEITAPLRRRLASQMETLEAELQNNDSTNDE